MSTIPTPLRVPAAHIECGSCRACCYQAVILTDEEVGYITLSIATPQGVVRLLQRRADGACVYLSPSGCGIYEHRPACCRRFHCGRWYLSIPRAQRKDIHKGGDPHDKQMLREGRKHAPRGGKLC